MCWGSQIFVLLLAAWHPCLANAKFFLFPPKGSEWEAPQGIGGHPPLKCPDNHIHTGPCCHDDLPATWHLLRQLHAMEAQEIRKQFLLWETQEKSAQHWKEWTGGQGRIILLQEQEVKLSCIHTAILQPTPRATRQANPHQRGSTGPCQGAQPHRPPVTQGFFHAPTQLGNRVHSVEVDDFGDTLSCRKYKDALEKKAPHQGVAARPAPSLPVLTAGTEPTKLSKVLRDFHPLSDILSSGLSRNVSSETISSCLRGGFSARKPLSWALGNPPALGQDPSCDSEAGGGGTATCERRPSRLRARGAAQTPRGAERLRQPGGTAGCGTRRRHRRGGTSAWLILSLGGVRSSIVQFPPPSFP